MSSAARTGPSDIAPVKLLDPGRKRVAAATLAEAFWDDPAMGIVAPDERKRGRVGPWFWGMIVEYGLRWGEVWADDEAFAVAVWFPPGVTWTTLRGLRAGMAELPFRLGLRPARQYLAWTSVFAQLHHVVEGPHWYLVAIGTRPARQGRGLGSALVEVGTARADAAALPCYLETATEANVAFYRKRGFEVTGQVEVMGMTMYGMVRPSASPSASVEAVAT